MNGFGWKITFEILKQPVVLAIIILLIFCAIFYKEIIGAAGEHWVKQELKKLPKDYLVINNVMLIVDSKSSQIDHLVISKYGIFVIETKQYNGYLIGNDYDKKWTFKSGKRKYYINNPVHQNYGHVQFLKKALNLDEDVFVPIVCISSRAKVKVDSDKVVLLTNLIEKIGGYKAEILLDYEDIYNKLLALNITDRKKRKQHIRDTKKIIEQKELDSVNKCPKCGGDLVERNGKYGNFMGCSNYPRCRFTKK